MRHFLEYTIAKSLFTAARFLPFTVIMRLGRLFGLFIYYVIPYRKKVALLNIRAAFPEKSRKEIAKICRNTYINLGMTLFEYLCIYRMSSQKILNMVEFDPPDMLENLMNRQKGVIAVTGHFGSFELQGIAIAAAGYPMDVVVKPMRNPRVEALLDYVRHANKLGVIKTTQKNSDFIQSIRNNHIIALVSDQDAGDKGVFVRFFNIESSTPVGPAVLEIRTGAPIMAAFIIRKGIASYSMKLHELPLSDIPKSRDERIHEITQRYTSLLESYVRQFPDHYLWIHKRWKSARLYTSSEKQ